MHDFPALQSFGDTQVLEEGDDTATGEAIAQDLTQKLGILPEQLVEGAYVDLLTANLR